MAIENVNTIGEWRSKIVRNRVFDCHLSPNADKWQLKTLLLAIFYPCLPIVNSVFDFRLSGVYLLQGGIDDHACTMLSLTLCSLLRRGERERGGILNKISFNGFFSSFYIYLKMSLVANLILLEVSMLK